MEGRSVVVVAHIDVGVVDDAVVGEGRSAVFGLVEGSSFGGSR